MARTVVDTYRKAVLDAGISGRNWQKNEAYDDFTVYFNGAYTAEQRQSMKYDTVLKLAKTWWDENRGKYS
jgi:hypothetical protein